MPKHPLEDQVPYRVGTPDPDPYKRCQDAAESYLALLQMNLAAAEEALAAVRAGDYAKVCQLFNSGRLNGGTRDAAGQALRSSAELLTYHRDSLETSHQGGKGT